MEGDKGDTRKDQVDFVFKQGHAKLLLQERALSSLSTKAGFSLAAATLLTLLSRHVIDALNPLGPQGSASATATCLVLFLVFGAAIWVFLFGAIVLLLLSMLVTHMSFPPSLEALIDGYLTGTDAPTQTQMDILRSWRDAVERNRTQLESVGMKVLWGTRLLIAATVLTGVGMTVILFSALIGGNQ